MVRRWALRALLWRLDRRLCGPRGYWLFILGVNNSGTTLLANLLAAHPDVRSLPAEGQLLTEALPRPDRLGVVRIWTRRMDAFRWTEADDPLPALSAKRDWGAHLAGAAPGIIIEKSPPNTLRARWLQANFRPSRFIAIVRDPLTVCEGMRRREGFSLDASARHWLTANRTLLEDLPYLKRSLLIRYEDLTDKPAEVLAALGRFLELSVAFPADALASLGAHSAAGETRGIKNLNSESRQRLTTAEAAEIWSVVGDFAAPLGYCGDDRGG